MSDHEVVFEQEQDPTIEQLKDAVLVRRRCAVLVCDVRRMMPDQEIADIEKVRQLLDLFMVDLGYSAIGARWLETNHENGLRLLRQVLWKDLAYNVPIMEFDEAVVLADQFFDLFPVNTRYFTNGTLGWFRSGVAPPNYGNYVWGEWTPITHILVDTGIVIISPARIGILWFADQD